MNIAQGLLSSHTSAHTPLSRKELVYLEKTECTCIDWAQEPPFQGITSTSLFPRIKFLTAQPSQSRCRKILLLQAKHIAKALPHLPGPASKQSLFWAPSLCLQSVTQSGTMEFPFGETGRRTNPLYQKDATSCSPQVCNKLSWVAYWGTEKGTMQFRQGFCPAEPLHN